MITTRRRLAGLLLVPVLALAAAACGDDDTTSSSTTASPGTDTDTSAITDGSASGVEFSFLSLDSGGPNTKAALEAGDIDIAVLYSSDGAIAANSWVALEDDKDLQPADRFVPAIRTEVNTPEIAAVLDEVSAALTVQQMQEMVAAVAIDGENPEDVAAAWLEDYLTTDLTATGSLNVGSSNFAESNIAAQIYGQALAAAGVDVEYTPDIGARDVYFAALESGEIDLVPEFTGTLLAFLDADATPSPDVDETVAALRTVAEERGITILEPAEADSVNTFVVTQETADTYGLATVSDLATVEEPLVLGGAPECPERPYCILGLVGTYGLTFES